MQGEQLPMNAGRHIVYPANLLGMSDPHVTGYARPLRVKWREGLFNKSEFQKEDIPNIFFHQCSNRSLSSFNLVEHEVQLFNQFRNIEDQDQAAFQICHLIDFL